MSTQLTQARKMREMKNFWFENYLHFYEFNFEPMFLPSLYLRTIVPYQVKFIMYLYSN